MTNIAPGVALALVLAVGACGAGAPAPATPIPPPPKSLQLNQPGELVDVDRALAGDFVTVVDFWGEHCGACTIVGGMLAVGVAKDDRILIRKIDVGDGFTPVAQHYQIGALPHYRVYDKRKQLRYVLVGNDCLKAPEIAKLLAAEP